MHTYDIFSLFNNTSEGNGEVSEFKEGLPVYFYI